MYKIKKTLVSILCLLPLIAFAKEKSNPDDVAQFESTGICVNCDLGYITLYGNHPNANVQDSNLVSTSTILRGDDGWNYSGSNFIGITGYGMDFGGDRLTRSTFRYATLRGANFGACDLTATDFLGVDVTGVNFANANLYGSNLTSAQLATASSVCGAILPDGSIGKCSK